METIFIEKATTTAVSESIRGWVTDSGGFYKFLLCESRG